MIRKIEMTKRVWSLIDDTWESSRRLIQLLLELSTEKQIQDVLRIWRQGECMRCGSETALNEHNLLRCPDETCPFSDYDQDDPRGWENHPEPPQRKED